MLAVNDALLDLLQIVGLFQIFRMYALWLQIASVAIYLDLINVAESGFLDDCRREFVYSCLFDAYLCPFAGGENGVGGVCLASHVVGFCLHSLCHLLW